LYVEALSIYKSLAEQQHVYSQAMLLKMAFIYESTGNYTAALYYLNLYYTKHPSRSTLKKMEALAQQHGLQGYGYSDYDFFATQARKYYFRILEILLMGAVTVVTVNLIFKLRRKKTLNLPLAAYLMLLGGLFYYLNFLSFGKYGIVNKSGLALMSGPSAGSNLLRTLPRGNRVKVNDQTDIWVEVELNDTVAFARKSHLLLPDS
ncbi:MAG: SH3 domain-containing protein, partial [Chitinophagaceae bacterium]